MRTFKSLIHAIFHKKGVTKLGETFKDSDIDQKQLTNLIETNKVEEITQAAPVEAPVTKKTE